MAYSLQYNITQKTDKIKIDTFSKFSFPLDSDKSLSLIRKVIQDLTKKKTNNKKNNAVEQN